jgi:hypothetical protein
MKIILQAAKTLNYFVAAKNALRARKISHDNESEKKVNEINFPIT